MRGRVVGISGRGVINEPVDDYLGEGGHGVAGEGVPRLGAEKVGVDGEGEVGDVGSEEVGEAEGVEGAGGWGFVVDAEELGGMLVVGADWSWKRGTYKRHEAHTEVSHSWACVLRPILGRVLDVAIH